MTRTGIAGIVLIGFVPFLGAAQEVETAPAFILELPESVPEVLIADTGAARLYRFGRTASGVVRLDERYMSIGLNGVGKEKAWDRKTPLGVYFITERLDTRYLDDKYGVAAYPLDYPNAWDRFKGRSGDGIWLHGMDRNSSMRPPRDTDGCLALPNDDLLLLGDSLKPNVTPVIVARELTWATRTRIEDERRELRLALDLWRLSLEQGDSETQVSLYADEFQHDGMGRESWVADRLRAIEAAKAESVSLSDVLLIADPEDSELYLSRFTQEVTRADAMATTVKRLYWRRPQTNLWQIIAEDSG